MINRLSSMLTVVTLGCLIAGCATGRKVAPRLTTETWTNGSFRCRILEFGTYEISGGKRVIHVPPLPRRTPIMYTNVWPRFVLLTDRIPARLGTHFGFTFEIEGPPLHRTSNVLFHISHPPIRDLKGATQTSMSWFKRPTLDSEGRLRSFVGYQFERPSELVTGTWFMQVYVDGHLLARKTFEVVELEREKYRD